MDLRRKDLSTCSSGRSRRACVRPPERQFLVSLMAPLTSIVTRAFDFTGALTHLLVTGAPARVLFCCLRNSLTQRAVRRRYAQRLQAFLSESAELSFTADFFTVNIPRWCEVIDRCDLLSKPQLKILEIGSYEGLSTTFFLRTFPDAVVTCVDAWDADAYKRRGRDATDAHMAAVELRFDSNTRSFKDRIRKIKKTSMVFFAETAGKSRFDLVYVDGPHYCDDVLSDALHSFDLLRVGGILICDDYLWRHYRRSADSPAAAINCVLRLKRGMYRLVHVGWQVILQKTQESSP